MERNEILDGLKMISQSARNAEVLTSENEELKTLSDTFSTISQDVELQGKAADAFRQQMVDYKNLIDSEISVNGFDYTDNNTLYTIMIPFRYDGNEIIQGQIDALRDKAFDEGMRDFHYNEWMNSNLLNAVEGALHYYSYKHYCGCVDSDIRVYEYWVMREEQFESIKATSSTLFSNSVATRTVIYDALSSLQDNFVDGSYKTEPDASWRIKLVEKFKDFYYTVDASGNKEYDAKIIYEKLDDIESLSDQEYQALLDTFADMGIPLTNVEPRSVLKEEVFNALIAKIHDPNTGDLLPCPFDQLTYAERDLYVQLYEFFDPDGYAGKLWEIEYTFQSDGYEGWEKDVTNIKFLAYTADEPYKSMFFNFTDDMVIRDLHYTDGSQYFTSDFFNYGVYLDASKMDEDKYGAAAYTTFFHELGHLIDYNLASWSDTYTSTYTYNDVNLRDTLEQDVRSRINEKFEEMWQQELASERSNPDFGTSWYQAQLYAKKQQLRAQVVDYIMNEIDIEIYGKPSDMSTELEKYYDYVVNEIQSDLDKYTKSVNGNNYASDIYGGFTGNTLISSNSYGHSAIYNQCKSLSPTYTRLYWVQYESGNTSVKSDGTGFKIRLDNGDPFSEDKNFFTDSFIGDDTDEQIIHSAGNIVYNNATASEMFAEYFSTNMTRDVTDNYCFEFYSDATIQYMDQMMLDWNK